MLSKQQLESEQKFQLCQQEIFDLQNINENNSHKITQQSLQITTHL